jgi:hypothetical protein
VLVDQGNLWPLGFNAHLQASLPIAVSQNQFLRFDNSGFLKLGSRQGQASRYQQDQGQKALHARRFLFQGSQTIRHCRQFGARCSHSSLAFLLEAEVEDHQQGCLLPWNVQHSQ